MAKILELVKIYETKERETIVLRRRLEQAESTLNRMKTKFRLQEQVRLKKKEQAEKAELWLKQEYDLIVEVSEGSVMLKQLWIDQDSTQKRLEELKANGS